MNLPVSFRLTVCLLLILPLASCGGGGASSSAPSSLTIAGTVGGLSAGNTVVLQDGAGATMTISGNTSFFTPTPVASGLAYDVTVQTQPVGQTCTVNNGSGTVTATSVGNVSVVCSTNTYKIGVMVAGLTGPGLVLQNNGADNLAISASGAAYFATPIANGLPYQATVFAQPAGQQCAILSGAGTVAAVAVTVAVNCLPLPNSWTWVGGSDVVGAAGVYGTLGTPAAGNVPSARYASVSWTDSAGNFWLFGGAASDSAGNQYGLNDLWEYSHGQWTWVGGSNAANATGTYGSKGVAAAGNVPGARYAANSWIDSSGHFWLFGGQGYDSAGSQGFLNDLWEFSGGQWRWVSGSNTINANGSYGAKGSAAAGNVPGARLRAIAWTDAPGNLWFFGGLGFDSAGNQGNLNDLWEYSAGQWIWVGGSDTINASAVYGTKGIAAPGNVPSARYAASSWLDASGNVWLFGGGSLSSAGQGFLNDLWEFSAGQWTWIGGSSVSDASGVYGTEGVGSIGNAPGARYAATSWIDAAGNFWLFGGAGLDAAGNPGNLNDLWQYSAGQWKWIDGSNTINATGFSGTAGIAAAANVPGGHYAPVSWIDAPGNLWLFGGARLDPVGNVSVLNDLWRYTP
ncbi:MAG TPA: hypothetical protein VII70_03010 [Steroidobacteraceae bacterium]